VRRTVQLQPIDCDGARASVSAQLDGELPESEHDRLETHLLLCPDCSAWAGDVRDTTLRLREAALETPSERFILPRLRRSWRVGSAVAVASAAAVVATMFFAPGQGSQEAIPQVSGFVGATGQNFVVSRLGRLEDGVYSPAFIATASHTGFRHV
jgi:Putative zinc-finger